MLFRSFSLFSLQFSIFYEPSTLFLSFQEIGDWSFHLICVTSKSNFDETTNRFCKRMLVHFTVCIRITSPSFGSHLSFYKQSIWMIGRKGFLTTRHAPWSSKSLKNVSFLLLLSLAAKDTLLLDTNWIPEVAQEVAPGLLVSFLSFDSVSCVSLREKKVRSASLWTPCCLLCLSLRLSSNQGNKVFFSFFFFKGSAVSDQQQQLPWFNAVSSLFTCHSFL